VNAVVKVVTRLDPIPFLKELLAIEAALGRSRRDAVRFGPRTLDMDLILFDKNEYNPTNWWCPIRECT
jgi:2-amino-4-hydroxy-6-hydroxymethyldihydropteridine diphosphokinase